MNTMSGRDDERDDEEFDDDSIQSSIHAGIPLGALVEGKRGYVLRSTTFDDRVDDVNWGVSHSLLIQRSDSDERSESEKLAAFTLYNEHNHEGAFIHRGGIGVQRADREGRKYMDDRAKFSSYDRLDSDSYNSKRGEVSFEKKPMQTHTNGSGQKNSAYGSSASYASTQPSLEYNSNLSPMRHNVYNTHKHTAAHTAGSHKQVPAVHPYSQLNQSKLLLRKSHEDFIVHSLHRDLRLLLTSLNDALTSSAARRRYQIDDFRAQSIGAQYQLFVKSTTSQEALTHIRRLLNELPSRCLADVVLKVEAGLAEQGDRADTVSIVSGGSSITRSEAASAL